MALGVLEGRRVDDVGARAVASQLEEVGLRGVPETLRTLGVDGERALPAGQRGNARRQCLGCVHNRRQAVRRRIEDRDVHLRGRFGPCVG